MSEEKFILNSKKNARYINDVIIKDYLRFLSKKDLLIGGYDKKQQRNRMIEFRIVWAVYDTLNELENRYVKKEDRKKNKEFFSSQNILSEMSGLSKTCVKIGLKLLEQFEIIEVIRHKFKNDINKTNEYILFDK